MTNDEEKFPTIWRFLSGLMEPEAPLCDWRLILGDQVDFEKFKNKYLLPTDKLAVKIYCPEPCNSGCRFREISDPFDDVREAVCMEYMDSYPIEDNDIRIKMFRDDVLFTEAAQAMGVATKTMAVLGVDYTWELGSVPGYPKIPVYGTLLCIGYELLNLFSVLNRKTKGPYILLVTNDSLIKPANKQLLDDYRSSYVALNKTVKFNADADLELIGDFDLKNLVALPHVEAEAEPENIFRKCGDAWEIRFQGGEKFMLTTGNTGASYLHFMLARPNVATPVTEIMRSVSGESEDYVSPDRLDEGDISSGFAISDLPSGQSDVIADETALRQYQEELNRLKKSIEEAEYVGDNATAELLKQELEELRGEIKYIFSDTGQKKNYVDQIKNFANACHCAVYFCIDKINAYDPLLSEYLRTTIKGGRNPGYFPSDKRKWIL